MASARPGMSPTEQTRSVGERTVRHRRPALASTGDREFGRAPASTNAAAMAHYRAYFIGQDGHFIKARDVVEADDRTAMIAARAMAGLYAIELWERDRKIVRYDAAHHMDSPDVQPGTGP